MAKGKDIAFVPAKELENEINERDAQKRGTEMSKGEKGKSRTQGLSKNVGHERKKK